MEQTAQPTEIAREAIKRLATRRLPPTPENFRRVYLEVAGTAAAQPAWPEAIRSLLKQWESYHAGLTQAKKREMLDRVLINFANDPDQLAQKLAALAQSWAKSASGGTALEAEEPVTAESVTTVASREGAGGMAAAPVPADPLGRLVCDYLEQMSSGCEQCWPDLAGQGKALSQYIVQQGYFLDEAHIGQLASLWREFLLRAEDDHGYLEGLKRLLGMLFGNIGELVAEDAWLAGQMTAMRALLSEELNPHTLFLAEESLNELIQKQREIKGSMNEAKEKLKKLISTFIARLGELSESTGGYNDRIRVYSARIAQAEDIAALGEVIDNLSADVTRMQGEMQRTHEELVHARQHAEEAEAKIETLEKELEQVSSLVREDQLTGALNRRGLDEALSREEARAERTSAPLSLALLDVDHFKRLNDELGHIAGDQALIHLAKVIRKMLRPTDALARYGGEEFLVVLPNSDVDEAEKVMLRLQRELTREYFLHDNRKVLITFSAGVAQRRADESQGETIGRADAAMYRAKAAGRNRVERG